MSPFVVDSSVAIKWYIPEALDANAQRLRSLGVPLHAPDFLDVEIAAILWKKIQKGLIDRRDASDILTDLSGLSTITRHPTSPLIVPAFDIANRSGRTVYDCLYLALALQLGGKFVTADEKLVNSLTATMWDSAVMPLRDLP